MCLKKIGQTKTQRAHAPINVTNCHYLQHDIDIEMNDEYSNRNNYAYFQ